jgi:twitching motility protein PilT
MRQRGTMSLAFRVVPFDVPTIEQLGLPEACKKAVLEPRGLILVTGAAGSGKSTTMAAMIDHLNKNVKSNVIIIEEPIEYLHSNHQSIIAQRDIGDDTQSFSAALKHSLHHDPDVIVIGDIAERETMATAIKAAQSGHLVMATMYSESALQTIDNIVDMFPFEHQSLVRLQLSHLLVAITSQKLLPKAEGKGRVAAFEILMANREIKELLRDNKIDEIAEFIEMKGDGMQTMEQALAQLVKDKTISRDEAIIRSDNPEKIEKLLSSSKAKV